MSKPKTIALVACVKNKLDHPAKASEMYIGDDFKSWMEYAQSQADLIFIVSGKYGLLELDDIITPYDVNLNNATIDERKEWSKKVVNKLSNFCELKKDRFILLTNPSYYEFILPEISNYTIPISID